MPKRPALDPGQLGFTFDAPALTRTPAALAGLDRMVASAVAEALKADDRSREEIAGAMTALLGEDCSRWMLDGYASEARENVNISFGRFLALVATTERFDLLETFIRRIGASLLVGPEIETARLGHIQAQITKLQRELKTAKTVSRPIQRMRRA